MDFKLSQQIVQRTVKKSSNTKRLKWFTPRCLLTLLLALAIFALAIKDYFLLDVFSLALIYIACLDWLNCNSNKYHLFRIIFNRFTARLACITYCILVGFTFINPSYAGGTDTGGSCNAENTLLGPIATALIGVFSETDEITQSICQVFVSFAAVMTLSFIGTGVWGVVDNQGRGTDPLKAAGPFIAVVVIAIISRVAIRLIMGV